MRACVACRMLLGIAFAGLWSGCGSVHGKTTGSCSDVTCSGHGTRRVQGGSAICACDYPYVASGVECGLTAGSAYGVFAALGFAEVSCFVSTMGFSQQQYQDWARAKIVDIGAQWTRSNTRLIWDRIESTIGAGYDWSSPACVLGPPDAVFGAAPCYAPRTAARRSFSFRPTPALPSKRLTTLPPLKNTTVGTTST